MKQLNNINKADYNYEEHTWGHKIDLNGLDFPRLKFDYLFDVLHSKKPEKVLEVGCGAGKFIFALADRFPKTHFTGVDISMQAISKAKAFNQSEKIEFLIKYNNRYEEKDSESLGVKTVLISDYYEDISKILKKIRS